MGASVMQCIQRAYTGVAIEEAAGVWTALVCWWLRETSAAGAETTVV